MQQKSILALSLLCMSAILIYQASAVCNQCNDNGASCIDKSRYHLCYNNKADNTSTFTCPAGSVCTNSKGSKCMPGDGGAFIGCNPEVTCDNCATGRMFTCTSRTTFVQCANKQVKGTCPEGLFCQASGRDGQIDICVSECIAKADVGFDCDSVEEVQLA